MDKNLLETLVGEIVSETLDELTARTGPRTGAFSFPKEVLDGILNQTIKRYQDIKAGASTETLKTTVVIPSPITGKPYKIPVWYFWDPNEATESGYMQQYRGGFRGRVGINVARAHDVPYIRSVIFHELVHLFDKQLSKGITSQNATAALDTTSDVYWQTAREKKAFLQQAISEMELQAKRLAERVSQGFAPEISLAKSIEKKPWLLLRHVTNINPELKAILATYAKDTEFMKALHKASFEVMEGLLKPALVGQVQ